MTRPIKATGKPYLTVYTFEDGSKEVRTGGWPAWRNNNPGNLEPTKFSYGAGAIGETTKFAIFLVVQIKLLKLEVYQKLTLAAAIAKYAPKKDKNKTEKYIAYVVEETGIAGNTPMSSLNGEQLMSVLLAMRTYENYKIGDIKISGKPGYVDGDGKMLQYIWRTKGDKKTRMSHRMREGAVFSWENPPPGGHPGEDFNCRCWAEELSQKKAMPKMKPRLHAGALQWD